MVEGGITILVVMFDHAVERPACAQIVFFLLVEFHLERFIGQKFGNGQRRESLELDFSEFVLGRPDNIRTFECGIFARLDGKRVEFRRILAQSHLLESALHFHLLDIEAHGLKFRLGHAHFVAHDLFELLCGGTVVLLRRKALQVVLVHLQFQKLRGHLRHEAERHPVDFGKGRRVLALAAEVGDHVSQPTAVLVFVKGRLVFQARFDRGHVNLAGLLVLVNITEDFHIPVLRIAEKNGLLVRIGMHGHLAFGLRGRGFGFLCHCNKINRLENGFVRRRYSHGNAIVHPVTLSHLLAAAVREKKSANEKMP